MKFNKKKKLLILLIIKLKIINFLKFFFQLNPEDIDGLPNFLNYSILNITLLNEILTYKN